MMKTKHDNDVINFTSVVYIENDMELSWSIRPSAIYDKNLRGQQCDQLYKCDLC